MGLHKTASTSFQMVLDNNRNFLCKAEILYPEVVDKAIYGLEDNPSHFIIPRRLLKNDLTYIKSYLDEALKLARQKKMKTVLISSEDFETILIESFRATQIEKIAIDLGYEEIHWICILRNQWDYFNSLYAQLAELRTLVSYEAAANEVINYGELSVSNGNTRWRFAFDYDFIIENFLKKINGSFSAISFDNFVESEIVGAKLLDEIIDNENLSNLFWKSDLNIAKERQLVRRAKDTVETDYLGNFLSVQMSKEVFSDNEKLFIPLIQHRLSYIDSIKDDLKNRFSERFPKISNKI